MHSIVFIPDNIMFVRFDDFQIQKDITVKFNTSLALHTNIIHITFINSINIFQTFLIFAIQIHLYKIFFKEIRNHKPSITMNIKTVHYQKHPTNFSQQPDKSSLNPFTFLFLHSRIKQLQVSNLCL